MDLFRGRRTLLTGWSGGLSACGWVLGGVPYHTACEEAEALIFGEEIEQPVHTAHGRVQMWMLRHVCTLPALPHRVQAEARASVINLGVAWALVALCCTHHAGHVLHAMGYHEVAHAPLLTLLADPRVSGALGAFALLGPGRT